MVDCQLDVTAPTATPIAATVTPATELAATTGPSAALSAPVTGASPMTATVLPAATLAATTSAPAMTATTSAPTLEVDTTPAPPFFVAPEELDMTPASRLFVADSCYRVGTTDQISGGGDNSWLADLAQGRVPQLGFSHHGVWRWTITGYLALPTTGNTVEVQPLLDGAGFGPVLALGSIAAFVGTANFNLAVEIAVVGAPTDVPVQQVIAHLRVFKDDGTSLADIEKLGVMQADETVEHSMTIQIRKALATASHVLDVRSTTCVWDGPRSGV